MMNQELANALINLISEETDLDTQEVRESLANFEENGTLKQFINTKGLIHAVEQDYADA